MQRLFVPPLLALILVSASFAHAQSVDDSATTTATSSDAELATTTSSTSPESMPHIIEDQAGFQADLNAHRTAFQSKLQERVYNLTQNIAGRMHAASARLANIADRMDVRATILAQSGTDSSAARPYIESARESLDKADALLSEDLGLFAYSENAREEFESVRERIRTTGQHLHDAHESLRGALQALKDAGATPVNQASSTEGLEVQ